MKKHLFLALLIVLLITGCEEKRVQLSELEESSGFYYLKDKPFTGAAVVMYDEDNIKEEMEYKDGMPHGIWKSYYENGKLSGEVKYIEGLEHGIFKSYHANGQLEMEGNYIKGKLDDSSLKVYYENGQLRTDIQILNP